MTLASGDILKKRPERRPGRQAIVLVGICSLIYLLDGLVHSILGPLAPALAKSLHLSRAALGPIFSANLAGQIFGLLFVPLAARRFGHRRLIIWSLVGFGFAQTTTAFASGRDSLIALRFVTGVFLGGALPSGLAIVADGAPRERRGLAVMILFAGYGGGAIVAGFLASFFVGTEGWRTALGLCGVACLVAALISWRWLVEPARPADDTGAAAAAIDGSVFRVVAPRMLLGTLMLWVMFVCALTINYCLNSWLPTLLVDIGRSPALAARSVSIFAAGGVIATLLTGALIDRFGTIRILAGFLGLACILLFCTGRVMDTLSDPSLLILLGGCGFFTLGAYGGINVVLANYYPSDLRAVGTGWTKSISRLGTVIAPSAIGLALTRGIGQRDIMSLFAVPALLALVALLVIGRVQARRGASG